MNFHTYKPCGLPGFLEIGLKTEKYLYAISHIKRMAIGLINVKRELSIDCDLLAH